MKKVPFMFFLSSIRTFPVLSSFVVFPKSYSLSTSSSSSFVATSFQRQRRNQRHHQQNRKQAHSSIVHRYATPKSDSNHDPLPKKEILTLLGGAIQRAQSTLDETKTTMTTQEENLQNLNETFYSATKNATTVPTTSASQISSSSSSNTHTHTKTKTPKFVYRGNPAITNTALAHSLWSSILRPHVDIAIDATCGNGYDSVVLAQMLFPFTSTQKDNEGKTTYDSQSKLICIDVQERACQNTRLALMEEFEDLVDTEQIQILHTSHAPLPLHWAINDDEQKSVALVVYNLGWLPRNSEGSKNYITQMDTTLQSIVDAMLILRIGGMLSVVTYPKTNAEEDIAVRMLLECAALLSSKTQTWKEFLEKYPSNNSKNGDVDDDKSNNHRVLGSIATSMTRLVEMGHEHQTWRVSEHKKLGMDQAPILLTATRIK